MDGGGFALKSTFTGGGFRHMTVFAPAGTLNLALMAGPAHAQTSATRASPRNHHTLTAYVRNEEDSRYITSIPATSPPVTPETGQQ